MRGPLPPGIPNPFAPRAYGRLEQITDRVYIYRNIVNSTVFVGDTGVAVVDAQVNQALARRVVAAVKQHFDKPITHLLNTHYHWDHTNGNAVFKEAGATLLAGRATAAAMVDRAPRQKGFLSGRGFELGPDPLLPDAYIEDVPVIDLGGLSLHFKPGHPAETADPTLSWCPEERILAAGDTVMTGSFPIFGQPSQREGLENADWLAAIDEVRAFGPVAITPGHGPVARDEELALLERICRYFLDTVRMHHEAGRSLDDTIRTMEEDMPAWITRIPEVWGTPRYAILRVWAGLEDLGQPGWQHVKPNVVPRDEADARAAAAGLSGEEGGRWIEAAAQVAEGGDLGQAISMLELAAEACADDPGVWTALGNTLIDGARGIDSVLEKGDCFSYAKHCWHTALERDPQHDGALLAEARYQVMMSFRNGDDTAAGHRLLDRAASVAADADDSYRAQIRFFRGLCHRTDGDEATACSEFQQALQLDGELMPARLALMSSDQAR